VVPQVRYPCHKSWHGALCAQPTHSPAATANESPKTDHCRYEQPHDVHLTANGTAWRATGLRERGRCSISTLVSPGRAFQRLFVLSRLSEGSSLRIVLYSAILWSLV
jgi:hypothetical protein